MPGHGEKQTRRQEQAIAALLTEDSLIKAAAVIGVNESTLRHWLRTPTFRTAYRQAREDVLQHALGAVSEGLGQGVTVLRQILRDGESPASARVAAVRLLFDLTFKDRELENLEARLAELEATVLATTATLAELQERLPGHVLTE